MRAIYVTKGSSLLPPSFASIFDDSASSVLDVFFDPSDGSLNLPGLTIGKMCSVIFGERLRGHYVESIYFKLDNILFGKSTIGALERLLLIKMVLSYCERFLLP